uniref:Reverse transcriptase domain-containing protein n=1 Tax=Trichuris muris TaxID=70415 RepID=A0A5S6R058_TRIMR
MPMGPPAVAAPYLRQTIVTHLRTHLRQDRSGDKLGLVLMKTLHEECATTTVGSPDRCHTPPTGYVHAISGTPVLICGYKTVSVQFEGLSPVTWTFTVGQVGTTTIGADFIHCHRLVVDLASNSLRQSKNNLDEARQAQEQYGPKAEQNRDQLERFQHAIDTTDPPVFARPRRLAPKRLRIVKAHFSELLRQEVIILSNSSWSSSLHLVPKWQPGTMTALRRLPQFESPNRARPFHCPTWLTSTRTYAAKRSSIKSSLFEFAKMPFSLRNAAQTFQRFLDQVLCELENCFAYVDNFLIASRSESDHRVDQHDIRPAPEKVAAMQMFPLPATTKQLRQFFGMINFYRSFCPKLAVILCLLNAIVSSSSAGPTAL